MRKVALWALLGGLLMAVLGTAAAALIYTRVNERLDEAMRGRVWDLPSRLYPAPLDLRVGARLPPGPLSRTLEAMGYRRTSPVQQPGQYRPAGEGRYYLRALPTWPGADGAVTETLDIRLNGDVVSALNIYRGRALTRVVIPPVAFGEIRRQDQETRKLVRSDDIPKVLKDAVIAVEDQRFLEHHGIDPRGLLRAVFVNVVHKERAQGGSTITQQLAKNYFLTHEKTFKRKITELFFALALERKFSKDKILELYLNEIYLGQRGPVAVSGVGQAAYAFFSKEVKQLTLDEAALIAGLIQSPNGYAPDRHPERAKARRDVVLTKMEQQGRITAEQAKEARARPITLRPGLYVSRTAPYFVDHVAEQLNALFPDTALSDEGFVIETTLDVRVQAAAEHALKTQLDRLDAKTGAPLQGAVVVVHPPSGRILAMVGGRDYGESQFNRVTQAHRQPGSVFKPLVILAAIHAMGRNLGPSTQLDDSPITLRIDGKSWSPQNSDRKFHGMVTVRETLEQSLNVPTVRLATTVGMDRIVTMLKELGISTPLEARPSLALGAYEVSPLEVAAAYTAVATDGIRRPPFALARVLSSEGEVLFEQSPTPAPVVSPEEAYLVRDMMRGVVERGTARGARALGYAFPASGKTGTTTADKDAWFVGFDADLLTVVWVGSDRPVPTGLSGARAAMPVWVSLMKSVRGSSPPPEDALPGGLAELEICPESRERALTQCPVHQREVFWETREPTTYCRVHSNPANLIENALRRFTSRLQDLFGGIQD